MALGAQRWQIVWMVLRGSLLLTAIGVAVGIPLAMAAAKGLESSLYQMRALDAASYILAVVGVVAVALAPLRGRGRLSSPSVLLLLLTVPGPIIGPKNCRPGTLLNRLPSLLESALFRGGHLYCCRFAGTALDALIGTSMCG